jgi:hypothetical protein
MSRLALLTLGWFLASSCDGGAPVGKAGGGGGGTDDTDSADSGSGTDTGLPEGPWRSALYPTDWAPGFSVDVGDGGPAASLPDFSYAGYHAGEAPLPTLDLGGATSVLDHGADPSGVADSTAAIQGAIDAVSALGGGVVLIPAGDYRVDGFLTVSASGVALAGEGADRSRLSFTRTEGVAGRAHLTFSGALDAGESHLLATDAAAGDFVVQVSDGSALQPGDPVGLGMVITPEFIDDHGMDGYWTFSADERRTIFQRTVVAVDGDQVTLDVPLRYPLVTRDAADLRVEGGALLECGLQDLAISSAVGWDAAWASDRNAALAFERVQDCWVRGVSTWVGLSGDGEHHLQSGGLIVSRSRRVTVADTTLERAQNRGGGGNGYLFEVRQSDEVLIRDSVGRDGRHNFIQNWDFGTTGCVFLRTASSGGEVWPNASGGAGVTVGLSEYHHALAMANLVDDSVADDGWGAVNRLFWSSGAGHTATESVFWNMRGEGALNSLQYGRGYVVGTDGLSVRTEVSEVYDSAGTAPEDWTEGLERGADLEPRSLYEDQLQRRLAR